MTRNMRSNEQGTARELERKLKLALQELKTSRDLCQKLQDEREESELEIQKVVDRNASLKEELAELDINFQDVCANRDELQHTLDIIDTCHSTHEAALERIQFLETKLTEAHDDIECLKHELSNINSQKTLTLYDELLAPHSVGSHNSLNSNLVQIGLDHNHIETHSRKIVTNYLKLKKKNIKLNGQIKYNKNRGKIFKNKTNCIQKISNYKSRLEHNQEKFDLQCKIFNKEIAALKLSLLDITHKYNKAQKDIKEYENSLDDIIALGNSNLDRYNSLVSKIQCHTESSVNNSIIENISNSNFSRSCNSSSPRISSIVMYSDEIGTGLGSLITTYDQQVRIMNNCIPNADLHHIMKLIINDTSINENTTLVLFLGRRGTVNKNNLLQYLDYLINLKVKKVVFFTLPYCSKFSQYENNLRYKLNLTLYNACAFNNKLHLIDTNKFVGVNGLKFFKSRYNLPIVYQRQIAVSLSYFFDISAKNLAIKVSNDNFLN